MTAHTAESVRAIVAGALAETGRTPPKGAEGEQTLAGDLGIDSLDFVGLIQLLEERLDVKLSDDAAAAVVTVDDLLALCLAAVAAATDGPA